MAAPAPSLIGALLATALLAGAARAQSLPPPPSDWIADELGALTPDHRDLIWRTIRILERDTGAEVGVYLGRTCRGANPAAYSVQLFNHWRIGKQGRDNGVLLMVLMDDGAIELTPGNGYQQLFTSARAGQLLDQVTPDLRARTGEAVLKAVRLIADAVRTHERAPAEPGDLRSLQVELERPFGGGTRVYRAPAPAPTPRPSGPTRSSSSSSRGFSGNPLPGCGILIAIPLVIGLAILLRPKCPRCNKYLSVSRRTLVSASYTSSGRGERTLTCACGYHNVEVYTISKLVKHTPRSSSTSRSSFGGSSGRSSSGGGRSSFGGGRSSGGGAGRRF